MESSPHAATMALSVTIILLVAILLWRRRRTLFRFAERQPCVQTESGVSAPSMPVPTQVLQTDRRRDVFLPVELVERIGNHLFEFKPPVSDYAGNKPILHSKPPWAEIQGWMNASAHLHNIGFARWLRVITVVDADDWGVILSYSQFVREIQCSDRALSCGAHQTALAQLPNLYAARIDTHSDVSRDTHDGFRYQDTVVALPASLRRLEVINAHGPDVKIIAIVKKYCPKIEELRLGRCTMFNRMPACDFWEAFPHDHDAYISVAGTDSYAHSLGGELSSLKNLRSLRMGLYLSPSIIVLAHRLYHRHGRVAPQSIDWQTAIPLSELLVDAFTEPENIEPATIEQLILILHQQDSKPGEAFDCQLCVDMTAEISRTAEMSANRILQGYVPSLDRIEWMGWLTPGHLGVHSSNPSA